MTRPDTDDADPKGLIRESFRIPGITASECRSVFLDWALSLPSGTDTAAAAKALLARHAPGGQDDEGAHPMVPVLAEAAERDGIAPERRGGWRSRR